MFTIQMSPAILQIGLLCQSCCYYRLCL